MQIDINDAIDGPVWVCQYSKDYRTVTPQIRYMFGTGQYREPTFHEMKPNNKGFYKSKKITYRGSGSYWRTGTLKIFDDEGECKRYFVNKVKDRAQKLETEYKNEKDYLEKLLEDL